LGHGAAHIVIIQNLEKKLMLAIALFAVNIFHLL